MAIELVANLSAACSFMQVLIMSMGTYICAVHGTARPCCQFLKEKSHNCKIKCKIAAAATSALMRIGAKASNGIKVILVSNHSGDIRGLLHEFEAHSMLVMLCKQSPWDALFMVLCFHNYCTEIALWKRIHSSMICSFNLVEIYGWSKVPIKFSLVNSPTPITITVSWNWIGDYEFRCH